MVMIILKLVLAVDLNQKANTATTYTNSEVDGLLVSKASTATSYTKTEVNGMLHTKASTVGTAAQFIKANGTVDSNTYLTTTGTAADSSKLHGITALQLFFNNMVGC
jgi:hypothetical protein